MWSVSTTVCTEIPLHLSFLPIQNPLNCQPREYNLCITPSLHLFPSLLSNQCYIIYIMGCMKSKHRDHTQNSSSTEKVDGKTGKQGEKAILVFSEIGSMEDPVQVNPVLMDYAQRLSEEIVARAVQQWAEVDSRYSDIPYIECDVP